jgi:hypothetical protein
MNTLHLGAVYQSSNLNDTETKLEVYPLCLDVPIVVTGRHVDQGACVSIVTTDQSDELNPAPRREVWVNFITTEP